MASLNLTERALRSLSTDQQREDFYDESFPSFVVRVGRTGRKRFCFRYRGEDGKYRRIGLGRYPMTSLADARTAARELEVQVLRGKDPGLVEQERATAPTVAQLVPDYLERYAKRHQRSWRKTERVLLKDVVPVIGHRKVVELKRREITDLVERIFERGAPQAANQALKMVRQLLSWAVKEEILEVSPCAGIQKPAPANSRDRQLSPLEIFQAWASLERAGTTVAAGLRLMLLTGQRGNEVRRMRWADLDGDVWTIPAEHAKNGTAHLVPLSPPARAEIERHRGKSETWVLPSSRGEEPVLGDSAAHLVRGICREWEMRPWTPHDLRRTVASRLAELGVDEFVIQRVLGHAYSSVTAIYNRYSYLLEKRQALELWGHRLLEITESGS